MGHVVRLCCFGRWQVKRWAKKTDSRCLSKGVVGCFTWNQWHAVPLILVASAAVEKCHGGHAIALRKAADGCEWVTTQIRFCLWCRLVPLQHILVVTARELVCDEWWRRLWLRETRNRFSVNPTKSKCSHPEHWRAPLSNSASVPEGFALELDWIFLFDRNHFDRYRP